jgi:translation initiation factor IF-3
MKTFDAVELAKSKGLDLIEVASGSNPPVAKIMSWNKYKYEQEKKKKDSKGRSIDQKEMWFKAFIGENDLDHKLKKVREFIAKKHPVKLTIRGQGRVTPTLMSNLMEKILLKVEEVAEADSHPKSQGRNISVIVKPRKTKLVKEEPVSNLDTKQLDQNSDINLIENNEEQDKNTQGN